MSARTSGGGDNESAIATAGPAGLRTPRRELLSWLRFAWAVVSVFVVESIIFGLAVLPAVLFWRLHFTWSFATEWLRILVISISFVPAYLLFAVTLMVVSAGATRLLGWRTPPDAKMKITEFDWPLLRWGRYLVVTHLVRVFAGTLFRATPIWTLFMRLNGARIGHGVFVNSLSVNDHNLLELGDHVVIGEYAHISGHTVEHGHVRTGRVRLGDHVTVGLQSVIGIDVEIGDHAQIGALSLVPKHSHLPGGATYVGVPVRRLEAK